jgi:mRNA interferase RelE/StbE
MYELRFTRAAENYFKKIREKALKAAFKNALNTIGSDPYAGGLKTGDLAGIYSYDVYYGGTNYEIAYRVYEDGDKIVVVILAGTRENFYNELKRYMK